MAWSSDDLADLEAAIAQGAMVVKYTDKTVQYRSLDEMMRIRDLMRKELGLSDPCKSRIYPRFSKGFWRGRDDDWGDDR